MSKNKFGLRSKTNETQNIKKSELAETIWSDLKLDQNTLPEFNEFQKISQLECPDPIEPTVPQQKPWSMFAPNLKLVCVQNAKIFSKAWIKAIEPGLWGSAEAEMQRTNLNTKQIFHCLRNNRDLLGATKYREMQEASYTMENGVELLNMAVRFRNPTDSNLDYNKVLSMWTEAGKMLMDTQKNELNSTNFDPVTLKLVGEALVVLRYLTISEKFPAMTSTLGEMDVYFKKAMRSLVEEFGERVSEQEWIKATASEVALMSKGLITQKCFKYILYITVERLMYMVDTMLSDKNFERIFFEL
jgi:hypothetical protein